MVLCAPIEIPSRKISFVQGDIVDFSFPETFDVVMSDNVYEHVAPADVPSHLASIRGALRLGGILILLTPDRLFGPCDVTRIIDNSYSGQIPAEGAHVNEITIRDVLKSLAAAGFGRFRSLLPTARSHGHLPSARIPTRALTMLESVRPIVRALQGMKGRTRMLTAFQINVIATAV
jgi:SAM-dependent methyltransferase